ncbi:helix-turn-helix domain-containing protein [Lactiplantibacillus plantarum]|uniref:helix-turn-helix domain-containing protein n=1 Tax=Lactiplantibacillus plantarum TaxID=1590 RepID=UPI001BACD5C6|nr:helix-turn-helix transcriptional regulator [Lactiplantibacillus plantarum]MBS0937364.1 helix-turn-helix transcriptional regulator [Lactiplantibacillus plantarum]MBS0945429.1 helix-turn-helix transcriptional regulator [Lactiplantibacillus plantarum]
MTKTTEELTHAIGRKRGELNITVLELSRQTGVSRWTLDKILSGERTSVRVGTIAKLNNWLYKQI